MTAIAATGMAFHLASITFTGRLASMTRREATRIVEREGGRVTGGVSRRTSLLVVGMNGWPLLPDGSASGKLRRAESLRAGDAAIEIISEALFLERAGLRRRAPELRKTYSLEKVCEVLGLEPTALRRWEALGLVRSESGQFDFQDLVSLRTVTELLQRGVPAQTIAKSVGGLARVLPGTDRPLAQLKLVERSGALLAELGDSLVAPDGQLLLRFEPTGTATDTPDDATFSLTDATPAAAGVDRTSGPATAGPWFDQGLHLEETDRYEEAARAYRAALAARPEFAEAHFNLGNVLRALERPDAAEEHFRMAVARDPGMACGWYNLADVQEEQGRLDEATTSLEAALVADPTFADAHYNLALVNEALGDAERARSHWRCYLRLDPGSAWAQTARAHLVSLGEG